MRVEATSSASSAIRVRRSCGSPEHTVWAGERQRSKTRLLSIDAPTGPAMVGTEFSRRRGRIRWARSRIARWSRRRQPGTAFEFVTEARLTTKKGTTSDWTNVQRYELLSTGDGCRIVYTIRVDPDQSARGDARLFKVPGLRGLVLKASARVASGVRNLGCEEPRARYAEERPEAG